MYKSLFLFLLLSLFVSAKHVGPSCDTRPRYALDRFANEFAKKNNLKFLNTGVGSLAGSKNAIWVLNFTSNQTLTLEQARPIVAELTYRFLYKIYYDPLFSKYMKEAGKNFPELKEEYAGFRLAFWDQNNNRPTAPFLAQIRFADGKIYYHYSDPKTQALQEPIVETLEALGVREYKQN